MKRRRPVKQIVGLVKAFIRDVIWRKIHFQPNESWKDALEGTYLIWTLMFWVCGPTVELYEVMTKPL